MLFTKRPFDSRTKCKHYTSAITGGPFINKNAKNFINLLKDYLIETVNFCFCFSPKFSNYYLTRSDVKERTCIFV